jgi:hypothetical protein
MKLLIAFAAVLSSAALTVPTVTELGQSEDERSLVAQASDRSDESNA